MAACDVIELLDGEEPVRSPLSFVFPELLQVAAGLKPAGRFTAGCAQADDVIRSMQTLGLAVRELPVSRDDNGYQYLSLDQRRSLASHRRRVYYAPDRSTAEALVSADIDGDARAIGALLGYPMCCVTANTVYAHTRFNDFVRVARVSDQTRWELNVFALSLQLPYGSPYYLISHFPCHLACEDSCAHARRVLKLLEAHVADHAARVRGVLELPVLIRDDSDDAAGRRAGLVGALLVGAGAREGIVYRSHVSLWRDEDLADVRLADGDAIMAHDDGLAIWRLSDGALIQQLDSRWLLLTF